MRLGQEQADQGRELGRQTQEMSQVAHARRRSRRRGRCALGATCPTRCCGSPRPSTRFAPRTAVLTKGDSAIGEEVAEVREDARSVMVRIADGLSRTVEQLAPRGRDGLDAEVFRFKLPAAGGGRRADGRHSPRLRAADEPAGSTRSSPSTCSSSRSRRACSPALLRFEDGMLVPDLAERWESDPTARRYRFTCAATCSSPTACSSPPQHVKDALRAAARPEGRLARRGAAARTSRVSPPSSTARRRT